MSSGALGLCESTRETRFCVCCGMCHKDVSVDCSVAEVVDSTYR